MQTALTKRIFIGEREWKKWGGEGSGEQEHQKRGERQKDKRGGAAKPACLPLLRSSRKEWEWMDLVSERGLLGLYTEPYSYNSAGMAMGPWAD